MGLKKDGFGSLSVRFVVSKSSPLFVFLFMVVLVSNDGPVSAIPKSHRNSSNETSEALPPEKNGLGKDGMQIENETILRLENG